MYNGFEVTYDMDGNMVSNSESVFDYDSSNRLVRMDGHFYTYNAEDVRIKCVCDDEETTYTYNTNCKLSQLLTKTTNGVVTKYVYGKGLIGEEVSGAFKTYHFDCRGSTIAITDASGNITDTFAYDTYGKLLSRTGTSNVIFGYNGRDGVVTDDNGLIYMRARYYSPAMKRFINADVIAGAISNAITLNRYAYANGNPVSNVDPFGLSPERGKNDSWLEKVETWAKDKIADFGDFISNTFDSIENALKSITDLCEDVHYIIIKNVDGSAGICIGMGFSKEFGGFGAEAISRADIIGIQLKDGKLRIGHPGRSALNISLPTSVPNVNVTLGPQSNSYENLDMDYTEDSDDVTYVDVGFSLGDAAAFVIGYHYDFSISLSGIINDLLEYFQ